ncbi:hypothetical protein POM88_043075 [Heracleum sosnowskyi]|uniref:Subtilisin-like protease n=1 Tax=Heracleum sosnowskyi TaxID=360622 RepID=A0AAD8H309_9APIA|nr:hypothetical protein POM88_043075 [Heracleum sosnowskyi]
MYDPEDYVFQEDFRKQKNLTFRSKKHFDALISNPEKRRIYKKDVDISRVPLIFHSRGYGHGFYNLPRNDMELLDWLEESRWSLRPVVDKSGRLEIYYIEVDADKVTVEECLELLKRIDLCESRFIACSVKEPSLFYADLNKSDVTRLEASNGISRVYPRGRRLRSEQEEETRGEDSQLFISKDFQIIYLFGQDKMNQGDHSSLNPGDSLLKIGVIDWGCNGTLAESDRKYFKSISIHQIGHSSICKNISNTTICPRGFSCASIICGTRRYAKFFEVCEKEFEGIYPEAQLNIYTIGCGSCKLRVKQSTMAIANAINRAIKDKVKVILVCMDLPLRTVHKYEFLKDDRIGMKLLEAHRNGILSCVPTGDEGPIKGSTQYGGPWGMTVGACTDNQMLETDIEIVTTDEHGKSKPLKTLKGVSLNVTTTKFLPLRIDKAAKGEDGILRANMSAQECELIPADPVNGSTIVRPHVTGVPLVSVTRAQVNQLLKLHTKHGGRLLLRILQSKYYEDERDVLVTNFSSTGPSRLYRDNLIPDVVASGHAVLMPHPTNIALNIDEHEPLFRDITIDSGTAYACAQVAAYALKLFSRHPDWDPTAVKSALITTASSFAEKRIIPGNEFAFGAGSVDIVKAMDPGLVYEESSYHFDEYVEENLTIFDLNLPTFAASFSHSHLDCKRIFKRELKNVSEREESYRCVVEIFDNSLGLNVKITAKPDFLKFSPGEKHKFDLEVDILPRPGPEAHLSAMIKWVPGTVGHQPVCSPVLLYHESVFDRREWHEDARLILNNEF